MATIRQDPFRDLLRLAGFDHPAYRNENSEDVARGERLQYSSWAPHVDIFEDKEGILLKVELPEVDAKDVEILAEGNTLTLRGERKLERADQKDSYTRIERTYGSFSRSFTLPTTIDLEHITAETKDGVLRVNLPKKPETKPRTIKVQGASSVGLPNANAAKQ
jgi:HSP20 family protein